MPLSDTAIRHAKPSGDKAFKLSDEKGLYLLIAPSGGMSGHGFRAMARTVLDEVLGFRVDYIEHQLFPYHSNFGHFFAGLPLVGRLPIWRRRFCICSGDSGGPWARR
ncbi:MAG: Arm DNA-binding domain-containing protein, partial [Methylococcaceae bacterium]|nr:Arm DNA-binding domain-containing protein [Methylococcaceae bacterium]